MNVTYEVGSHIPHFTFILGLCQMDEALSTKQNKQNNYSS